MSSNNRMFDIRKPLSKKHKHRLIVLSFIIPLLLWFAVSNLPFLWHPMVKITDTGSVAYFKKEMLIKKEVFKIENERMKSRGLKLAQGEPSNPIYLPAPQDVVTSLYKAFTTPPRRTGEPWLHESLFHSIKIIFWGFFLSSMIGVPLGILCGTFSFFKHLTEPFIEFFRYLPAPVFGALAVAILGINDGPKIAIIIIGTFFQQVLVISNTTRNIDVSLIEAAQTLGAKRWATLRTIIIPGILPYIYKDMRILLGWAWTYLVVAEVIGTSTGITWFINQQAKYRNFEYVYASILIIGIVGLLSDQILAYLGNKLFYWQHLQQDKKENERTTTTKLQRAKSKS